MAFELCDGNDLTRGISSFSLELYQECAKSTTGNIIVSPLSVASALALLQQGSSGRTFEELRNGLRLTADKETTATQFLAYYEYLRKSAGNSILTIANHVYIRSGYQMNPNFKFTSDIEFLDFTNAAASAANINRFVTDKTQGKIQNLVSSQSFNGDTQVVLVNAIYFKGDWKFKFEKRHTKPDYFYIGESERIRTDFLNARNKFNYSYISALDVAALEMKYVNSNLSFLIVLPNQRIGLSMLENNVKNFGFNKIIDSLFLCEVVVKIPKFKIEFEMELNDVLMKLGMAGIFYEADLSDLLLNTEPVKITTVLHKAFIEVNEEGSVAAAATMLMGVSWKSTPRPRQFHADHPFIYYIFDNQTKTILFNGRINNPYAC